MKRLNCDTNKVIEVGVPFGLTQGVKSMREPQIKTSTHPSHYQLIDEQHEKKCCEIGKKKCKRQEAIVTGQQVDV